ncbi:bifunctional 4-hydroxy-2-oxoglutarate aldolase/2-dehydro-3-deoxy-phosphogluconate aldolase [Flectobacillus longus]|uniref:bifunctional 4-hydroxy-2-oxoglutarate aldolase/2-dehydro-3-deoxy-phosphogluconate aldolase n=1 Tax=Flectobacillus longus TaxID=2984207 RepID=UPI0024B82BA3|nr:bifunctional 4-hydroxy-2-oxoglutarate aldolase/2-dehydro-3-deoxy-phosphogluconate aldolase [Flectobacillus longus]MDI9877962.1 bifunctional 4-hydroxy-2-oxoglutarate aldolase/2-dehydro-3-deoxy-phosphogluconate aldolase [Flectobacillus longus]
MAFFDSTTVDQLIAKYPVVPVFYHEDLALTQAIIKACYDGGMRAFEFTNRGESALATFTALVPFIRENCPDMAIGIGTIFKAEQAAKFIEVGADFVVQPVTTAEVGALCQEKNIAWYPGACTLNEIYQATELGATVVKIFPGNVVGPGFVKSMKGPMPKVKVMVTGGVEPTTESLTTWFNAGVTAVGMGSQLFPSAVLANKDFNQIQQTVASLMETVASLSK